MKVALCFNIHYKNLLVKEKLWKEWVYYNRDIINIYFHCKNAPISSPWIKKHCIPSKLMKPTSYFHIVPALMSLLSYAYKDTKNIWFCLLTDSCVPIVSPAEFRKLFFQYFSATIFHWSPPAWNIQYHKRANLFVLPEKYHLANDPWFVITRTDVYHCLNFTNQKMYEIITKGIIANESVFAIALRYYKRLGHVINQSSSLCDWSRMSSPTSPYVFKNKNIEQDRQYISSKPNLALFLRKIHHSFPDNIIEEFLYPVGFKRTTYTNELSQITYRSYKFPYFMVFLGSACIFLSFSIFNIFFKN